MVHATNEPPVPARDVSAAPVGIYEPIYEPFRLPIQCHTESHRRPLSEILVQDLELVKCTERETPESPATVAPPPSMYERLFQPTHDFGRQMIPEWSKHFSTDVGYLQDTQEVIRSMPTYHRWMQDTHSSDCGPMTPTKCRRLMEVWSGLHRGDFLEKYSYMEWTMLQHLNESSVFLQLLSIGNILSPVISLCIPILFLLFPFILLKIQGLSLTWEKYIDVLKNIAKNHFIGKAIMGFQSMSWDKLIYLGLMFGLYLMQIYQNVITCIHFYENTRQVNLDLVELRNFCSYSARSMDAFVTLHKDRPGYRDFCQEAARRSRCLKDLVVARLYAVSPFRMGMQKIGELGTMLSCYYHVHSCGEVKQAIRYAIGFEGYMDNMSGVAKRWSAGQMALATFSAAPAKATKTPLRRRTKFVNQYYPALLDDTVESTPAIVKNHMVLKKNMIVTGPNASGKTTFLKTTAINLIFTQQLGCGFYDQGSRLPRLYTHIHSYLNIPDTSERDSLFQAEARRCKEIIDTVEQAVDGFHFSIFDELYSGTNPTEASKAAYAFLKYLSQRPNVDFILTTHYVDVCKRVKKTCKRIQNYKMMVKQEGHSMVYTYRIQRGISLIEGAGKILKDMNFPSEIMDDFDQTAT